MGGRILSWAPEDIHRLTPNNCCFIPRRHYHYSSNAIMSRAKETPSNLPCAPAPCPYRAAPFSSPRRRALLPLGIPSRQTTPVGRTTLHGHRERERIPPRDRGEQRHHREAREHAARVARARPHDPLLLSHATCGCLEEAPRGSWERNRRCLRGRTLGMSMCQPAYELYRAPTALTTGKTVSQLEGPGWAD